MDILINLSQMIEEFVENSGVLLPLFSSLCVFLEGILAFLPLVVFVTLNIKSMGVILGFIVSWILTTLGSFSTFMLCRKGLAGVFKKFIRKKKSLNNIMAKVDKLKFNQLVTIMSIPFAPSFFINVTAGLSNISPKKYLYALFLGKIFVITYLGLIGTNIINSLTNPIEFIKVIVIVLVAYILSKVLGKKFDIDERFL